MGTRVWEVELEALGYRGGGGVDVEDMESVHAVVVWLENLILRQWHEKRRDSELSQYDAASFPGVFQKYLNETPTRRPLNAEKPAEALAGLIRHAVAVHARENQAAVRRQLVRLPQQAVLSRAVARMEDSKLPVDSLGRSVGLVATPDVEPLQILRGVHEILQASRESAESDESLRSRNECRLILESLPSGFSGDAPVSPLHLSLLRVLYQQRFRRLQTATNEFLTEMQSYTSSIQLDMRLGQVGR